jgi:hypothetical protein
MNIIGIGLSDLLNCLQGLASYNEMCDLYLMYWVWGNHTRLLQVTVQDTSV